MRNSIFGFNQEKAVEYNLTIKDLLLLDYIINAVASPSMEHELDDNKNTYVWLKHSKVLEDLPLLDVKEDMLKKMLKKLSDLELIQSVQKRIKGLRGTKSFYGITQKCEELKNTPSVIDYTSKSVSSVIDYTSDNKLNSNIDNTNNINIISRKSTKKNLYEKCIDLISDFTNNSKLYNVLSTYLKFRLEIKDKPLYANQFKGMLNKLNTLADNSDDMIKIVQQSLDNAWLSFYPLKSYNNKTKDVRVDIEQLGTTNIPRMSNEEKEELERRAELGELETF